jgi:ABC-type Zn uptake system ZnuABC Zn-binding protein ZnuA
MIINIYKERGMNKINFWVRLALLGALLGACSGSIGSSTQPGGLKVLATESFLGDIAQNVAGERLKVETLLPVTVDPHEFQPTPQDVIKIEESQVLIVNGLGYEAWLENTLANVQGQRLEIVATNGLTADPDPSGEHPDGDPHLWMNPLNVIHYVENIRDGFSRADPGGKEVYAKNAEVYIVKLKDLDQWSKDQVNQLPMEKRLLVTNHDALGYFAQAYGFEVVGAVIPSVSPDSAPSAQQMGDLINAIKSSRARAIFLDIGENDKLAQQIAAETGVTVVTDLYVETISAADGPAPTYIDMIKHDVSRIISALK